MNTPLAKQDIEALSAYLDGQLGQRQRTRLEARLQTDEGLRIGLDQLRATKAALRSTPEIPIPRSFTLAPEMVPARPARDYYPALRLASALTSILFVVVLLGDYAASLSLQGALAPAQEFALEVADQAFTEAAPIIAADAEEVEEDTAAESFAPRAEQPPGEGDSGADLVEEPPAGAQPVEALTQESAAELGASGEVGDDVLPQATPTLEAAPTQAPPTVPADELDGAALADMQTEAEQTESIEFADVGEPAPRSTLRPVVLFELLLGVTAATTGIVALLMRRRA